MQENKFEKKDPTIEIAGFKLKQTTNQNVIYTKNPTIKMAGL